MPNAPGTESHEAYQSDRLANSGKKTPAESWQTHAFGEAPKAWHPKYGTPLSLLLRQSEAVPGDANRIGEWHPVGWD
jgi:hypothetical protein